MGSQWLPELILIANIDSSLPAVVSIGRYPAAGPKFENGTSI